MIAYKFRAECATDAESFRALLPVPQVVRFAITPGRLAPDVTCELVVHNLDLPTLLSVCRQVEDSHVMLETLQPSARYTGERK